MSGIIKNPDDMYLIIQVNMNKKKRMSAAKNPFLHEKSFIMDYFPV